MTKAKTLALCLLLIFSVSFASLGYAAVTSSLFIVGSADADPILDIFISNVEVLEGNATVNYTTLTIMSSTVSLSSTSDEVTLRITLTNNSSHHKVFNAVKYVDESYSNKNIGFSLTNLMTGDHVSNVQGENTKTFDITFSFSGADSSNLTLDSILLFEFANEADWEKPDPGTGGGGSGDTPTPPTISVGEDFAALIEAARSDKKNSYGLNDSNKGDVLVNAVKQKGIIYSNDNRVSGGNLQHFATSTINAHNLDYLFEYVSDTEYVLYMWRLKEVESDNTVIGVTPITVYKQVYHYVYLEDEREYSWEKSATMAGRAVIKQVKNNNGSTVEAIVPSEWEIDISAYGE